MEKISYFDNNQIIALVDQSKFESTKSYILNRYANRVSLKGKKENLIVIDELKDKIDLFPHQMNVALKFLNDMGSRVLLADEVGLGKTIEACIILKELQARYEIKKILILTPASLTTQWQGELQEKFHEFFEINKSVHNWIREDKIICSIDTAKKEKHMREIENIKWDCLIIDESHKLKNPKTVAYKAISRIRADYKLFLTATPIQNSIMDLFHGVNLLDPG